jgi:hypothetical protein
MLGFGNGIGFCLPTLTSKQIGFGCGSVTYFSPHYDCGNGIGWRFVNENGFSFWRNEDGLPQGGCDGH